MSVSLQEGLYDLCRIRINEDAEFLEASGIRYTEAVDDALFDRYRLFQLQRTLRLLEGKSPFYGKLFRDGQVNSDMVRSLSDLPILPFTFPSDLSGTGFSLICTSQSEVEKPVTFFSSGSTGAKKRVMFSHADIQKIIDFLPRGMNTVVDREEARVQVFLQNSQGRGIGEILAASLRRFGMQAWTSDLGDPIGEIYKITSENRVNVWFGEAITILRATRILAQTIDLKTVGMKCIFITMTNIPKSMIRYLEQAWNCRVSTHYGLTESGWGLAVDCGVCRGYHYDELNHLIEIVDPDTGAVLPYGSRGEVVLTNLARTCMPLIRYRTGDIAVLNKSVCGSHLDVLGYIECRKEGMYETQGKNLSPVLFDETLFLQEELLDYRIFADGSRLMFEVEVLDPDTFPKEVLQEELMRLPVMRGLPKAGIDTLPIGALRPWCFEKKRILPWEGTKNA